MVPIMIVMCISNIATRIKWITIAKKQQGVDRG